MIARALTWAAVLASALVALGFVLFAVGQASNSSERQQAEIAGTAAPAPTPTVEAVREQSQGPVHEAIDDANDVLLSPFEMLVSHGDLWARRGLAAILALLVYGLGLGLLGSYARSLPRPLGEQRPGLFSGANRPA